MTNVDVDSFRDLSIHLGFVDEDQRYILDSGLTMQTSRRVIATAPRFYLFTRHHLLARTIIVSSQRSNHGFVGFGAGPAPPRLPKEEQETFEALQRQSTGAFSTPRSPPKINQSPDSSAAERAQAETIIADRAQQASGEEPSGFEKEFAKVIEARGDGEELHPNVRRGATPEFEGDVNPKTGEVGGPKNEPLRWGAAGEWSYNGRTTDF